MTSQGCRTSDILDLLSTLNRAMSRPGLHVLASEPDIVPGHATTI